MSTTAGRFYDQIAQSYYNYRHWTRWRAELDEMAQRWQRGRLLNIGCAHGPDFLPFKQGLELWGVDCSIELLKLAPRYCGKFQFQANLLLGDARCLPFPDNAFDWAVSTATYHHIQGAAAREQAFAELKRVLKPGGEAFVTVWNRWQPQNWLRPREVMLPWKTRGGTFYRYYYLFSFAELRSLLTRVGFEVIKLSGESKGGFSRRVFPRNICALVRKR